MDNTQNEEPKDSNDEELNIERGRFIVSENAAKTQAHTTVHWPTIAEFTDESVGLQKINEYIEKVIRFNLICTCL